MFILDKKVEQVDEPLRICLGDNNIENINSYMKSYYELMRQNETVEESQRCLTRINREFQNSCLTCFGGLTFFFQYPKYVSLGNRMDQASDDLLREKKRRELCEEKFANSYEKLMKSNVLERIEKTMNYYSTIRSINPISDVVTDEDLLYDLVLNHELELIEDHMLDKLDYDSDRKYATRRNKDFTHDYELLEEKTYNVALQCKLLKKYHEKNYDAKTIYNVIEDCYSSLERGVALDINRYSYLDDDIVEYVKATNNSISVHQGKKVKRR